MFLGKVWSIFGGEDVCLLVVQQCSSIYHIQLIINALKIFVVPS